MILSKSYYKSGEIPENTVLTLAMYKGPDDADGEKTWGRVVALDTKNLLIRPGHPVPFLIESRRGATIALPGSDGATISGVHIEDHRYGIVIDGKDDVDYLIKMENVSNCTITNFELFGGKHAGIGIKNPTGKPHGTCIVKNGWIHDMRHEGGYIGEGSNDPLFKGRFTYMEVRNITVERTGWDCWQNKEGDHFLISNVLFLDGGKEDKSSQNSIMLFQKNGIGEMENSIVSTGPKGWFVGETKMTFRNTLFHNLPFGGYHRGGPSEYYYCFFKDVGYHDNGAIYRTNKDTDRGILVGCVIDNALKDHLGNVELIDCTFTDLPDPEFIKDQGESRIKPGSFYAELGMGKLFGDEPYKEPAEEEEEPIEEENPFLPTKSLVNITGGRMRIHKNGVEQPGYSTQSKEAYEKAVNMLFNDPTAKVVIKTDDVTVEWQ